MARLGIFLFSFSFLEMAVDRTSSVHIEPINGDVEVNENEAATLPCKYRVDRDMNPRLEWKKKRNNHISFVYFDGSLVDKYKDRATMSGSSIILHSVTREDSATYRCEVMAKQDPVIFSEISFNLVVLVPPAVPTCIVPSSAMSGSTVELVCKESEGSPPSEYTWYKDNRPLLESPGKDPTANNVSYTVNRKTGLLTFNPVRKTNSGSYFCKAHNKVGQSLGCSIKFMQINDLDVSAIVISVVIVTLVLFLCGIVLYYAYRRGYLGKRRLAKSNGAKRTNATPANEDFKHTKSFII